MAFDPGLAQIFADDLSDRAGITSKKMFGGLCYLNNGHMLCGIHSDKASGDDVAMFRVGPDNYEGAVAEDGVSELSFTGRPMKGLVETSAGIFEDEVLRMKLLGMALDFTGSLPPK